MSADPGTLPWSELRSQSALARAVGESAERAMREGRSRLDLPDDPDGLPAADAPHAKRLHDLLAQGPESNDDRALLGALLSIDAARPGVDRTEAARLLVWTSASTDLDPLWVLDDALDAAEAGALWQAVGDVVAGRGGQPLSPAERCVGALALGTSPSGAARAVRTSLLDALEEIPIRKALAGAERRADALGAVPVLQGEMSWAPASPLRTALYAVTGILLVRGGGALLARHALGLRRPAQVRLTEQGLELAYRVELLGRTVRERASLVPLGGIVELTREVRFARAGTYAGLVALVLGTYIGITLVADGLRAPGGSPTLIGLGLGIVALGLLLDFGLTSLLDGLRRTVRLVVVPERGRRLCVAGLSAGDADTLLEHLSSTPSRA